MVRGMENYVESSSAPFIAIVQGSQATKLDLENGTVINNATKEVLAKKGKDFTFIPVYFYRDWTIWEDGKPVKRAFDTVGKWSDGSTIQPHEVNWSGNEPPEATEAYNFVVIPTTEFVKRAKDPSLEIQYCVLSFARSSFKFGKKVMLFINETCIEQKIDTFGGVFGLNVGKYENESYAWLGFENIKFVKKLAEGAFPLAEGVYEKVKKLSKTTLISSEDYKQIEEETKNSKPEKESKPEKPQEAQEEQALNVEIVGDDEDIPF